MYNCCRYKQKYDHWSLEDDNLWLNLLDSLKKYEAVLDLESNIDDWVWTKQRQRHVTCVILELAACGIFDINDLGLEGLVDLPVIRFNHGSAA